jgi:hypothetical protein
MLRPILAARVAGLWVAAPLEPAAGAWHSMKSALDSTGALHVVYDLHEDDDASVRYATLTARDGIDANCDGLAW